LRPRVFQRRCILSGWRSGLQVSL